MNVPHNTPSHSLNYLNYRNGRPAGGVRRVSTGQRPSEYIAVRISRFRHINSVMDECELDHIIGEILSGRIHEYSRIVREFGLVVRGFLHARVHHAEDAEDLAQEVFITAYRDLATFRRGESFQAWLLGIARHRLLMHFRTTESVRFQPNTPPTRPPAKH
jgi:hypothetical protein